jgi:uroporphyrin-3 C-methyltransferase
MGTGMNDSGKAEHALHADSGSKPAPARQTLGALALIIALLALLAAGWAVWQMQALQQLPARISADSDRLVTLTRQADSLASISKRQEQQIADLAMSLEDGLAVLPEMSNQIRQTEQRVTNLPVMDSATRNDWLKKEALNYLQIANAQASLAGNAQMAASALQFADEKLRDTEDPAVEPVRAQLAKDIAVLQALPQVDRAGISFQLQALANQSASWPFQGGAPDSFKQDISNVELAPGQSVWQQFLAKLKAVFSGLVIVRKTNAPPVAQLGAAERALIVAEVDAELQLARLALAASDAESFRQSLQQLSRKLKQFFDTDAAAVAAALGTLEELQAVELPGSLPDVSGALTLLLSNSSNATPATESVPATESPPAPESDGT